MVEMRLFLPCADRVVHYHRDRRAEAPRDDPSTRRKDSEGVRKIQERFAKIK